MKKVVVFQQVPHETLGTIGEALGRAGLGCQIIKLFNGESADVDMRQAASLVVLGGPMNVGVVVHNESADGRSRHRRLFL